MPAFLAKHNEVNGTGPVVETIIKAPPFFFAADDNFKFCCFFKNNK